MYLWHSAFLFLHQMEYWNGWEYHDGFLWLYAYHSPRGFPWSHSHTWLLLCCKTWRRGLRRDTPAPETRSRKGYEKAEGRVSKTPRKLGSAEKDLPRANEEKTWEELLHELYHSWVLQSYMLQTVHEPREMERNAGKACEDTIRILPKTWRSIQSDQLPLSHIQKQETHKEDCQTIV